MKVSNRSRPRIDDAQARTKVSRHGDGSSPSENRRASASSGQSASQVVQALEDEPTQGRRRIGVRREPVLDCLGIRLVPAGGEEPDDQPGGDLLTTLGPQPLDLPEVAGG